MITVICFLDYNSKLCYPLPNLQRNVNMKAIVVPTDFSDQADNAARYAVCLAKDLKRDVSLYHALFVPMEVPIADAGLWPLEDFSSLKEVAIKQLRHLAGWLERTIDDKEEGATDTFKPAIDYQSVIGPVTDVIMNVMADSKSSLVVMGMSGSNGLSRFFMGSRSKDLVDHANFPVLLVPGCAVFKGIKKLIFATDLNTGDISVIRMLAGMAKRCKAEIRIYHITGENYDKKGRLGKVEAFNQKLTETVHYPHISYHHLRGMNVDDGLDWLCEHGQIDLLAMVHRPHTLLFRLLSNSHTHQLAGHIKIPLLVFPPEYNVTI